MKAIKLISALSVALLLIATAPVYANTNTGSSEQSVIPSAKPIIYEVQIDNSVAFMNLTGNYVILVTDGNGRPVAPPQRFVPKTFTYYFQESAGIVTGKRIATMILESSPASPHGVVIKPSILNGPFMQGMTYIFRIFVL